MLNSVSFGQKMGIYDKANVDAPQANTRKDAPMANHPRYEEPKKKHTALKVIAGLVAAAVATVGAIAIGSKMGWLSPDKIKKIIPNKLLNAEKLASLKEPVKNGLAAVEKFGNNVAERVNGAYESVINFGKGLFKRGAEAAEEASTAA